jgi:hypothetical protein
VNWTFKLGSVMALLTTILKVVSNLGWVSHPIVDFVAANSAFFYGLAVGVVVSGLTRRLVLILLAVAGVYVLLRFAGM